MTKNSKQSCRGAVLPYIELPKVGIAEPSPQPLTLPVVVPVASPIELNSAFKPAIVG